MIPLKTLVKWYKSENRDAWGIVTDNTIPTELKGMVQYSTEVQEMKTTEGETVQIMATIVLKGMVSIKPNDKVSFGQFDVEKKYKVVQVQPVQDLSGKVLFTRVVV